MYDPDERSSAKISPGAVRRHSFVQSLDFSAFHNEDVLIQDKYKDRSIICSEILCDNPSLPASFFRSESFLKLFPQAEHGTFPTRGQLMGTIIPTQVQELKADLKQVIFVQYFIW